jgi:uncharacterized protein
MPVILRVLALVGTAAMLWVGGGIIVHGLEGLGLPALPHILHEVSAHAAAAMPFGQAIVAWLVGAIGSAIVGVVIGGIIVAAVHMAARLRGAPAH